MEQEYEVDKVTGKIEAMILFVTSIIDTHRKLQKERLSLYGRIKKSEYHEKQYEDIAYPMDRFCLALDNYFTLPKVIKKLRDKGIGIVGTARARRGWPPTLLNNIQQNTAEFNDFYHMVDDYGTLVAKWMDNGLVLCVSTLHRVGESICRKRKRPRVTVKNKNHVSKVWKDSSTAEIYIPQMIDDYNHWMGGVDLSDQRIAYYHPNLRCVRNWIPMFIQLMSIIRNNCYIVYRSHFKKEAQTHKDFLFEMINCLMKNAHKHYVPYISSDFQKSSPKTLSSPSDCQVSTRSSTKETNKLLERRKRLSTSPPTKRRRIEKSETMADVLRRFPSRTSMPIDKHIRTTTQSRGSCIMCTVEYYEKKLMNKRAKWNSEVKRTSSVCSHCTNNSENDTTCYLCKDHFRSFHTMDTTVYQNDQQKIS